MKLFMVSDGDYSDYRVHGIYSTIEKAEYAKKLLACKNDIEEIELDDIYDAPKGMFWHEVQMDKNGYVFRVTIERPEDKIYYDWKPYVDNKSIVFYMWATDSLHAVKIANEKRVYLIANDLWEVNFDKWRENEIIKQNTLNGKT